MFFFSKTYCNLVMLILAALLLFFLHFFIYNLPHSDDFAFAIIPENMNSFTLSLNQYFTISSRVFSNFLYHLFTYKMDFTAYKLITFSSLVFFMFVVFLIIRRIFRNYNITLCFFVWILFISAWIFGIQSPNDSLFWMGGVTTYSLPMALLLFASYLLFMAYESKNKMMVIIYAIIGNVILFIASFSNESLFISFFLCYCYLFIYSFYIRDKRFKILTTISLLILFVVLILVYLSPGNAVRINAINDPAVGRLFWSVHKSLMTTLERGIEIYFLSMLIPVSIMIYFVLGERELPRFIKSLSLKWHAILFFSIGISIGWAAHFIIAYGLGSTGLPPRAKLVPQSFYLIFFILGNIYLLKYFSFMERVKKVKIFSIVLFIWLVVSPFFSTELTGSILCFGEHKIFYKAYTERLDYLQSGDGFKGVETVILKKLPTAPPPISNRHLSSDCSYYINTAFASYYKIDSCVRIEEGFDGDASSSILFLNKVKRFWSDGFKEKIHEIMKK